MLQVKMLGGFSIKWGDTSVISEHGRENKVTHLIEYLLVNRKRSVPQEELIDVLLAGDDSDNPVNVLKNIVYRARKLFSAAGMPDKAYIYRKNGAYGFSSDLPCEVDVERFEAQLARARREGAQGLAACLEAIAIYRGDFLPRGYGVDWVVPRMVRYQNMYQDCVLEACKTLRARGRGQEALHIIDQAIALYPTFEAFRIQRMECLYEMKRIKDAIVEYEAAAAMLFDELGVNPSQQLRDLYLKVTTGLEELALSLDDILEELADDDLQQPGAFYCNFPMFSNTYRFVTRHMARSGQSAFVMLCTLSDGEGTTLARGRSCEAAQVFHRTVRAALRRSDVYTRYSPSQFLVLLMNINQENCKMVAGRMEVLFRKFVRGKGLRLEMKAKSAVALQCREDALPQSDLQW
nr:BTAD domain-containing putative transcriptional regulator [Maliibacterium massiliense]